VKNKSLKFKLAVSTVCKPGEYDIILHQPDAEKLVLKGKLKITGSK
jgi:hypothetical protein